MSMVCTPSYPLVPGNLAIHGQPDVDSSLPVFGDPDLNRAAFVLMRMLHTSKLRFSDGFTRQQYVNFCGQQDWTLKYDQGLLNQIVARGFVVEGASKLFVTHKFVASASWRRRTRIRFSLRTARSSPGPGPQGQSMCAWPTTRTPGRLLAGGSCCFSLI